MPETYKLLLLGGGHAHVMTLRRWAKRRRAATSSPPPSTAPSPSSPPPPPPPPLPRPRLALVSEAATSCYSGMLPGVIAGLYAPEQALVPLEPLCAAAGFDLIVARVTSVSSRWREVEVEVEVEADDAKGAEPTRIRVLRLGYETLSLDVGSTAEGGAASEAGTSPNSRRSIAAKPVHSLLERLRPLFDACDAAAEVAASSSASSSSSSPPAAALLPSVVVVGGGAAGVEIAAAVAARLERARAGGDRRPSRPPPPSPLVSLVAGPRGLLPEESRSAAALVSRELRRAGVRVVLGGRVVSTPASVFEKEEEEEGRGGGGSRARGTVVVEVAGDGDGDGGDASSSSSSSSTSSLLLPADFVIWCTGSAPHPWLRDKTDLELDEQGFVRVDPSLRCRSRPLPPRGDASAPRPSPPPSPPPPPLQPSAFAAGDCASVSFSDSHSSPSPPSSFPTPPKSGVYAVRAGEQVLFPNLRAAVGEGGAGGGGGGDELAPPPPAAPARWSPSRQGRPALSLLSLGNGRAVALWPWRIIPPVAGRWVWLLKDFIDRRWVGAGR